MKLLTLKELCEECGVTRRAVQVYESLELLEPSGKNDRGYLLFDERMVNMVKGIKKLQNFGFSLKEIGYYKNHESELSIDVLNEKYEKLVKKRELLDVYIAQIAELICENETKFAGNTLPGENEIIDIDQLLRTHEEIRENKNIDTDGFCWIFCPDCGNMIKMYPDKPIVCSNPECTMYEKL